jgi:hypothetical protein
MTSEEGGSMSKFDEAMVLLIAAAVVLTMLLPLWVEIVP